jgi:hypothetical protein
MLDVRVPEWEPLVDLAPLHLGDFMWMFAVELRDRTRLQAYKHWWHRGYLHLDGEGRAFIYVEPDRYEEVEPQWLLGLVLKEHSDSRPRFGIVRPRHLEPAEISIDWAASAAKNGIAEERSAYVMRHCGWRFVCRPPFEATCSGSHRFLFLGEDSEGVRLEVEALGRDRDAFLVFHAAPMRDAYELMFGRCKPWGE